MVENRLIKIINIILVILLCASVLMSGVYLYYHFFVKPNHVSIGVNYFSKQSPTDLLDIDNLSEDKKKEYEDRTLFEVNFYDNSLSNGIPLCEFRLNYFTDNTLKTSTCRSVGLQGFADYSKILDIDSADYYDNKELFDYFNSCDTSLYLYTFQDDISWAGYTYDANGTNTVLNNDSTFIVSINNNPYLIKLDGTRTIKKDKKFLFFKVGETTENKKLSWYDLYMELLYSVRTNSKGYGNGYFIFDCSDYFKDIKAYNPETKKFDKNPDVDIAKNYSYVKFSFNKNGATKSTQSLFGLIKSNAYYGDNQSSGTLEYWQSRVNFNIDDTTKIDNKLVMDYRYSEAHNGYLVSINLETSRLIKDMPTNIITVTLDLDRLKINNYNVVGLDLNAFNNIKIDTLIIKGSGKFYLLKNSLYDTEIKSIKKSSAIELSISSDAINSEYEVVIL